MNKRDQILKFLQDAGGSLTRTEVHNDLFKKNASNSELDELLRTILAGLVVAKKKMAVNRVRLDRGESDYRPRTTASEGRGDSRRLCAI